MNPYLSQMPMAGQPQITPLGPNAAPNLAALAMMPRAGTYTTPMQAPALTQMLGAQQAQAQNQQNTNSLLQMMLGAAKQNQQNTGPGMSLPGGGMFTLNGGFGGVNPFSGFGFGSMAPGGLSAMPGGAQVPSDLFDLGSAAGMIGPV